jgi:abortive infection bacteriophage resistance protein
MPIPFNKPVESLTQSLERLQGRGLVVEDSKRIYAALTRIGYYRLSGYMTPFQTGHQPDPHRFKPNVRFEHIEWLYEFDKRLRSLIIDGIEAIEVALRSALCNRLAATEGAHWHMNELLFYTTDWNEIQTRVADAVDFDLTTGSRKVGQATGRPKTGQHLFLDHYYATYSTPSMPPSWMTMEVASFGLISKIFASLGDAKNRKSVADLFIFPDRKPIDEAVLTNWVHSLSVLRNRCAHHSRLVYRNHTFAPKPTTNTSVKHLFNGDARLRELLVVIAILMRVADPKSAWLQRLFFLFDTTSEVNLAAATGFDQDWRADRVWDLD